MAKEATIAGRRVVRTMTKTNNAANMMRTKMMNRPSRILRYVDASPLLAVLLLSISSDR